MGKILSGFMAHERTSKDPAVAIYIYKFIINTVKQKENARKSQYFCYTIGNIHMFKIGNAILSA